MVAHRHTQDGVGLVTRVLVVLLPPSEKKIARSTEHTETRRLFGEKVALSEDSAFSSARAMKVIGAKVGEAHWKLLKQPAGIKRACF